MSDLQAELDERFPFGGAVTQIEDVVEGVGFDDSTHFLVPRLVVMEDEVPPTIQMLVLGVDKDVVLTLLGIEEISPGVTLLRTPDDHADHLVSVNVDPETEKLLRKFRAEEYGEQT